MLESLVCGKALRTIASSKIKYVNQLNSVDGETFQSLPPQQCVGQFGLVDWKVASPSCHRLDIIYS